MQGAGYSGEDGEYNGMGCHDGVPSWFLPQRANGCTQTSCYVSQPTEKVRQHTDQSGKSNHRYSNLRLCLFLAACLPKLGGHQQQRGALTSAAFPVSPRTKTLRFQHRRLSAGGWHVKLYLIKGKMLRSEALCPPRNSIGQKRQAHYRSAPPRHIDQLN